MCQEYITPDCLKHTGVPAMSTKVVSSLTEKKNKSQHSPGRFRVIISGMNKFISSSLNQTMALLLSAQRAEKLFNSSKLVAPK